METVYVVQGFQNVDGAVLAQKPLLHVFASLALSRAAMIADKMTGVLVYAQEADTDRGQYSQPVILAQYGETPELAEHGLLRAA